MGSSHRETPPASEPARARSSRQAARGHPRTHAPPRHGPAHRAGLRRLDPPLHPRQRQAPSALDGCAGGRGLPDTARHAEQGDGVHREPGLVGLAVPVSRGSRYRLAVDGGDPPRQASQATAGGAHPRRGAGPDRRARRCPLADGQPVVRHRFATDGGRSPAGQGRGLRARRTHRAPGQGREGPAHRSIPTSSTVAATASAVRWIARPCTRLG